MRRFIGEEDVDKWDQATVQKKFRINGPFRRGIFGDFSDIRDVLADW